MNLTFRNGGSGGAQEFIATLRPLPPGTRSRSKPGSCLGDAPVDTTTATRDVNNCSMRKHGRKIHLGGNGIAKHHRSGWAFALEQLRELHASDGIYFDDFVEKKFSRAGRASARHALPYAEPWVGIMHNPPESPTGSTPTSRHRSPFCRTSDGREACRIVADYSPCRRICATGWHYVYRCQSRASCIPQALRQ